MALIEIPNVHNPGSAGRGRPAVIGEPLVAVDLINTAAAPGSAAAGDLLSAEPGAQAWWRAQAARVPAGDLPDIGSLRRLRAALRDLIEALVDGRPVPPAAVADLNWSTAAARAARGTALAPGTRREPAAGVHRRPGGRVRVRPGAGPPAPPVRQPGLPDDLHRGQPPAVMVRPGVCGNRVRVARHHRRAGGTA